MINVKLGDTCSATMRCDVPLCGAIEAFHARDIDDIHMSIAQEGWKRTRKIVLDLPVYQLQDDALVLDDAGAPIVEEIKKRDSFGDLCPACAVA